MDDALLLAIIGIAGTVAVALVTVAGTIASTRIQARTAERNRDREDAVRADERAIEERRRRQEQDAEAHRLEQQRLADAEQRRDEAAARAAEAHRQAEAVRVAHQHEVAAAFIARAQTLYRVLVFGAQSGTGAEPDRAHWDDLGERLGAVMLAFDADTARQAVAAVDTLQELLVAQTGQQATPDAIERLLGTADDQLAAFVQATRAALRERPPPPEQADY